MLLDLARGDNIILYETIDFIHDKAGRFVPRPWWFQEEVAWSSIRLTSPAMALTRAA